MKNHQTKSIYLTFFFSLVLSFKLFSQIPTRIINEGEKPIEARSSTTPPIVKMPTLDINTLKREDKEEEGLGVPPRFGKDIDVNYTISNSGNWEDVDGGKLWKLEILSEDAKSINLIFDDFYLSKGAEINIYNKEMSMVMGPITSEVNNEYKSFATDIIKGQSLILELFEPSYSEGLSSLRITKVIHGYVNLFNTNFPGVTPGFGASAPCHNDINCSIGDPWQEASNSVAMVLLANNTRHCSGVLVTNECQDFTPNFLTAFHCVDVGAGLDFQNGILSANEIAAAQNWVFRFQYKSPVCDGGDGITFSSFVGSIFRAAWRATDFAVFELNNRPASGTGITYSGWSRANTPPTTSASIHHPNGDVMKISIENNIATSVAWFQANTHWRVTFDDGVVQHGSSGSPLFNQEGRVVGQLHGNQNYNQLIEYCDQPIGEYGRFDVSWGRDANGNFLPGRDEENSLAPWLDPNNSNVMTTNTIPIPTITGPSLVCTSGGTFTLNNVPPGSSINWSSSPNLVYVSGGQGTNTYEVRADMEESGSGGIGLIISESGPGWVSAFFNGGCGSISLQKSIWVGPPSFDPEDQLYVQGFYGQNPITLAPVGAYNFLIEPSEGASNYSWDLPSGFSFLPGYCTNCELVRIITSSSNGNYVLKVYPQNGCGSAYGFSSLDINIVAPGGGGGPSPGCPNPPCAVPEPLSFPNPAKSTLNVKSPYKGHGTDVRMEEVPYQIKIYNKSSGLVFETSGKGDQTSINLEHLPNGHYILHIISGNELITNHLIIDR